MAERFGGQFSPGAARPAGSQSPPGQGGGAARVHPFQGKVPTRLGLRVNLLLVVPFLFVASAFASTGIGFAMNLAAFGLLMLAGWLTREGIRAEAAFDARAVARRPAIPRKIFGSIATALGLGVAAGWQGGIAIAAVLGAIGGVLHFLAFGPDPLKDKGVVGDEFNSARVAKAVDSAEAELKAMSAAIEPLRDRDLTDRVNRFQSAAREMFRAVEQDPRDLTAARKYMGVYLSGARASAEKFAAYYTRSREAAARTDFIALLDDLEGNFAAKTGLLLQDDRSQLDIEMEVLRERLGRETEFITARTPQ